MTLIILLFVTGLLLLAAEVVVPGGILGVAGGLALLAATVATFTLYGSTSGSIALVSSVLLAGGTVFLELFLLRHTRFGKKAFLSAEISATSANLEPQAKQLIGQSGQAATMLSPSGYVTIDGQSYEAFCPSGQVPAGSALRVVGADNFRLIVSPNTSPT